MAQAAEAAQYIASYQTRQPPTTPFKSQTPAPKTTSSYVPHFAPRNPATSFSRPDFSTPRTPQTPRTGSYPQTPKDPKFKCYRCGQPGHFASQCPNQNTPRISEMEVVENPLVQNPPVNNNMDNSDYFFSPTSSLSYKKNPPPNPPHIRSIQRIRGLSEQPKDTPIKGLRYQCHNRPDPEIEIDLNTSQVFTYKRKEIPMGYTHQDFVNYKKRNIKTESNYLRYIPPHKKNLPPFVTFPNNIPLGKKPKTVSFLTLEAPKKRWFCLTCKQFILEKYCATEVLCQKCSTISEDTTTSLPTATITSPVIQEPLHPSKKPTLPNEPEILIPKISQPLLIQIQLDSHPVSALIDTGASLDIINSHLIKRFHFPTQTTKPVKVSGFSTTISQTVQNTTQLPTSILDLEPKQWSFFVADTHHEVILGVPWLRAHRVQFDWTAMQLRIGDHNIPFTTYTPTPIPIISAFQAAQSLKEQGAMGGLISLQLFLDEIAQEEEILEDVKKLIDEFQDRFPSPLPGVKFANLPPGLPPDRGTHNHSIPIQTDTSPFFRHPRRLTDLEYEVLKERIKDLLRLGHIQPSSSPWDAPILFVRKKDGTLRLCIDYRALNKATIKNIYPLPLIAELIDKLRNSKFFTKIDLDGAYHQIRLNPEDILKSGFNCQLGHFEMLVMTFGFTNAPATFQHLMNHVFNPHQNNFLVVYLDDILIFSQTREEHLQHIR